MRITHNKSHLIERTLVALSLVLLLLLSSINELWSALDAPWYSPYVVWAIAIAVSWLLQRYLAKHEL